MDRVDLRAVTTTLTKNGETVSRGTGAALWLAATLAGLGDPLRAGGVLLTGALGPMAVAAEGDAFRRRRRERRGALSQQVGHQLHLRLLDRDHALGQLPVAVPGPVHRPGPHEH